MQSGRRRCEVPGVSGVNEGTPAADLRNWPEEFSKPKVVEFIDLCDFSPFVVFFATLLSMDLTS